MQYSLAFANTGGEVLSAVLVFCLGALIAFFLHRTFRVRPSFALALYVWHTLFSIAYLIYSRTTTADATAYFLNSLTIREATSLGTNSVTFLTSFLTQNLSLSYGGTFLAFNIVGFIGMLAFASVLKELTRKSGIWVRRASLAVILLPGLSFWSAAIGKDALAFFAVGVACWVSLDTFKRYPWLILAIVSLLVARPHMAALLVVSFSATLLTTKQLSPVVRFALITISIPAAVYIFVLAQSFLGFGDGLSATAITEFVEQRQSANAEGGLSLDIAQMTPPMRAFSYMYRPLFVDGGGFLGLVVSFESLFLLVLTMLGAFVRFRGRISTLPDFSWWFMVIFALTSWIIMSNTTANLGIAMRQKWMFLPMVLALCFSYFGKPPVQKKRAYR